MATHHHPDGASTTTAAPGPSWFGIQTMGPVLMILFGLVLMFTPLASVGAAGSVGNAGAQFPKCPPAGGGGQVGGPQLGGGAGIVLPGDPVDCPPATTAAPTTAAPTTAPPATAPPATEPPSGTTPTDDTTPTVGPGPDEQPEVGGIVAEVPEAEAEVLDARTGDDTGEGAVTTAGGSTGHDTAELAFTGPNDSSLLASLLGAVLVLGGGALLLVSRRRSSPTC